MSSAPIDVCLSVDVEFSTNNALTNPERPPLGADWVYGESGGQSQGLGFLLDCLDRHGLRGTFFTEVFNSYCFGDAPMAGIVRDTLAHGHDVQLHLHPVWLYFKYPQWRDDLTRRPSERDLFTDRDSDVIADWLRDGAEILARLSGSRPIAFRSGNLDAGLVLYQGMRKAGIGLASNIGAGLAAPVEDELMFYSGLHSIEGVTEVPVTTYRIPVPGSDRLLLLTATGSAFAEMRAVLNAAYHLSAGPVVMLLHPQDFRIAVSKIPGARPNYRPDPVRQSRLERLCAYLSGHPERFRVTTFAESAERWQAAQSNRNLLLSGSLPGLGSRLIENRLLPVIRRLPQ